MMMMMMMIEQQEEKKKVKKNIKLCLLGGKEADEKEKKKNKNKNSNNKNSNNKKNKKKKLYSDLSSLPVDDKFLRSMDSGKMGLRSLPPSPDQTIPEQMNII